MKILFVGDIHTHLEIIKDIKFLCNNLNLDRIILLGDYVDDWVAKGSDSVQTLNLILELKNELKDKLILLLGNHELSYLGYPCSGHNYEYSLAISTLLKDNISLFNIYYKLNLDKETYFCSHAGITDSLLQDFQSSNYLDCLDQINKNILNYTKWLHKCSYFRGGSDLYSSLLWADQKELLTNCSILPNQIVGHTPQKTIFNFKNIYFIDTHSTYSNGINIGDESYLLWNDKEFEKINNKGEKLK